jgi:hypothetical protein
MRAPKLSFSCFVADRFERNCHFYGITLFVDYTFRVHHDVDAEVFAAALRESCVTLNTYWIKECLEGFALIVEGVEKEPYVVVRKNIVPPGHG